MEIIIRTKEADDYGEGEYYELSTPKYSIGVGHMEPEDATLNRDLSFVYDIENMLREAYEAGKDGEEFHITYEEAEDE
jgi:hypothetical protein